MIYLICGLPGSGKTNIAKMVSKKLKCERITTEDVRYTIFGFIKGDRDFTKSEISTTYAAVSLLAENTLLSGAKNIVVDGAFRSKEQRDVIKKMAKQHKHKIKIIEVKCSDKTARERLAKRGKKNKIYQAAWKARFKVKKSFEPIKEKHYIIDSEKNPVLQLSRILP